MRDAPARRWALPALLAVVAAAYAGVAALGHAWDDHPLVLDNALLARGDLLEILGADFWSGAGIPDYEPGRSGYYRPLVLLSYLVDRRLLGGSAAAAHLHSLGWHLAAVALLHRLVRRWLGDGPALAAAALFGLHPLQSEAVAWIAARNDPMAAALGLAALDAVLFRERPRTACAALLAAAAGLAKESVVLLPLFAIAAEWAAGRRPRGRVVGPLLLGVGVVLLLRAAAGVGLPAGPGASGWGLLFGRLPLVLGTAMAGLLDPFHLSVGRSLEYLDREPAWRTALGGVAGVIALVGVLVARPRRAAAAGLAWAALAFAPSLAAVAKAGLVGERYLYFPLAGLGVVLGAAAGRWGPAAALLLAGLGLAVVPRRLPAWMDDVSLWASAVEESPNPFTHLSLAHALRRAGRPLLALREFRAALDDPLPDLAACPRLVGTALSLGRPALAASLGDWARERGCRVDLDRSDAGLFAGHYAAALLYVGRIAEARAVVARARPDPERRLEVVAAALARLDGDERAWARLAASWPGRVPLDEQVDELLARAGLAPPAPGSPGEEEAP